MQNDQPNKLDPGPQNWLWSDCKLVLRRTNPKNLSEQSYQNLQAEVELESEDIQQPFIPILQFQQNFQFNKSQGFYWKKGQALPSLKIKLQKSYFQLLKQDEQLTAVYCELAVAYPKRKQTHFYLEQIHSIGQKRKIFSRQGQVRFDDIVLKQCSHQKSNSKFSILVTICASSIQQNKIILKTLISTAFYTQNSRINRNKVKKQKIAMKLISPNSFLKPLKEINQNIIMQVQQKQIQQKNLNQSKKKIIQSLKLCNKHAIQMSLKHPFYIFYHFSDIFRIYYDSHQVKDLGQLLERISPQIYKNQQGSQQKFTKNAYISYVVKKDKKIKKKYSSSTKKKSVLKFDNPENVQKKINHDDKITNSKQNLKKQLKKKLNISAIFKQGQQFQKKLLVVTFQDNILETIENQLKISNNSSQQEVTLFKQQLQTQISKIQKFFARWTKIYMKIDLLKNQSWSVSWKGLQKQSIYQAYKSHYYIAYDKLLGKKVDQNNLLIEQHQQIS